MNAVLCGLRLDGCAINRRELFPAIARLPRRVEYEWFESGAFGAFAQKANMPLRPLVGRQRAITCVGDVRLDNAREMADLLDVSGPVRSHVQLAAMMVDRFGVAAIDKLRGDFAFVAWDASAQRLFAVRDPFGVKPLFYRKTGQHLLLASRLDPLCGPEEYDLDYIADFVIGLPGPSPRTIWRGTVQVEPGSIVMQRGSVTTQTRYWSATDFAADATISEHGAIEEFRNLFTDAVGARMAPGETWAQLSGGLDSSAVVSVAGQRLNGTVTIADSLGSGDESFFCDAVTRRYDVANSVLRDYWPWRNDGPGAPRASDEPTPLFPFFERDRRMVDVVVHGGGRVLLSGLGSDHYMFGTLAYMADLLARGAVRASAREVMGWAMQTRRSFWHTAQRHVVQPMLYSVRPRRGLQSPRWLRKDFARRHHMLDRLAAVRAPRAHAGDLYRTHTAVELMRVSNWMQRGPFQDRIEMRYPFLSRDLVEFTLRLPIAMRVRPQGRKWVLREAMRGILPEEVRTRTQKGGMDARVLWAFQHEHALIQQMLRDPMLADLGCVDVVELRRTADAARQGAWQNTVQILSVLALESWLRARNGTWPLQAAATSRHEAA